MLQIIDQNPSINHGVHSIYIHSNIYDAMFGTKDTTEFQFVEVFDRAYAVSHCEIYDKLGTDFVALTVFQKEALVNAGYTQSSITIKAIDKTNICIIEGMNLLKYDKNMLKYSGSGGNECDNFGDTFKGHLFRLSQTVSMDGVHVHYRIVFMSACDMVNETLVYLFENQPNINPGYRNSYFMVGNQTTIAAGSEDRSADPSYVMN